MQEGTFKRGNVAVSLGALVLIGFGGALVEANDTKTVRPDEVKTWVLSIDGKDHEAHPSTPAYDGSTGLFHLPTAYTLPRGKVSFSLFRDNLDRDPKDQDISIHGLTFALGMTSRIELAASFGVQNRVDADALFQPGYVNDYPFVTSGWKTGGGDVKLGAKLKLLDDYGDGPFGLALRGYVKLPTADEKDGLGTGKRSTGLDLILSKSLNRSADVHASLGYQWNGDPESPSPLNIGNALKWGLGINLMACRKVQIQAEVTGSKYKDASFKQTNPVDFVIGPVFWFAKGLFIRPAISRNLKFDDRGLQSGGRSSTGMQFSVGYHPGTACCDIAIPPPPPPPPTPTPTPMPVNRPPTVTCEAAKTILEPGDTVGLSAAAADPDGDTLSYVWSSNLGRVMGEGMSATLDTKGVTGPASVSATVSVSDGNGGTAESTCNLQVSAPPPAETMTCNSGGFPPNRDRLNNVDKACLDDVAVRLRQDPRSRVFIVGHADRSERRPDVLARLRAESTKAYLVLERGVEDSRVTTRGALPMRSMTAAEAADNRRVEVTFVPEGALTPSDK